MIVEKLADIKIKAGRGANIFGDMQKVLLLAASVKVLLPSITTFYLILISLGGVIVFYIVGLIDTKYIGLLQKENELLVKTYNPYFIDIKESLNRIEAKQ